MKKQLRYPEYINGVKQVQCPFKRFCIKLWYSEWFRFIFVIYPIWLYSLIIVLLIKFPNHHEIICIIFIFIYFALFASAFIKNDRSELRRVGLDEYYQPIDQESENKIK